MTAAERQLIRAEVDRRQRARIPTRPVIDPAVYLRILSACCLDSPVDVEEHARRVATRVAQARGASEAAA